MKLPLGVTVDLVLLLQLIPKVQSVKCPSRYQGYENLCFMLDKTDRSWDDAHINCENNGGQELVSWNNDDSLGRYLIGQVSQQGTNAWIGLRASNKIFYWMDGTTYSNRQGSGLWDTHEPSIDEFEDCVEMNSDAGFKLNDKACWSNRATLCKACSLIDECVTTSTCKSGPDSRSTCSKCNFGYKPSPNGWECQKVCEYNNPCWPGSCSQDYLSNCQCSNGFRKIDRDGKNHCQLDPSNNPTIEKCMVRAVVAGGKRSDSKSNTSSTHCDYMQDFYGNFQPEFIYYDLEATFRIDTSAFPNPTKSYQTKTSNFGVTDVKLKINKESISGGTTIVTTKPKLQDASHGQRVKDLFSNKENMTVATRLLNGDRLCLEMMVKGGGYMVTKDTRHATHVPHNYEYEKTETTRKICYIMDDAKPIHKSQIKSSTKTPLQVSQRITRTGLVNVSFYDWMDPIPTGGDAKLDSGIEHYEVSLWNLNYASGKQSKGTLIPNTTHIIDGTDEPVLDLNLTSSTPRLYLLELQVKDHADNLGSARRFILYDETSVIEVDNSKTFTVTSASPATGYEWQTHHNAICLSWKDYFYNQVYMDNHFLDPIASDADITGEYEQGSGEIPVTGTPSVHGIVAFNFSWSRNEGNYSEEGNIRDFLNQTLCRNIPVKDGETYNLNITAIDIVNNTYSEARTVSIDRSVPHINNIWLINDGYESLFAHGNKDGDLTEIDISFGALDPNSGIREVQWSFGITDSGQELKTKSISVNETDNCDGIDNCICPSVGKCQITKYLVSLKGNLLPKGTHNRNYYFTIKVTNHAQLSNIEHIQILVDTSPPETGVVQEGPVGTPDMDYTSSPDFMVHWHGFVDHESGIKSYRIVMAEKCLTLQEMRDVEYLTNENSTVVHFTEVPSTEESLRVEVNFTGKYYITVAALNNAVQLSEPACSNGITRDETSPIITNITVTDGKWRETLHCDEDGLWLMHESLTKIRLSQSGDCVHVCQNATPVMLPSMLKERVVNASDVMIEEFMCENLKLFSEDVIIYLPSDHIELSWDLIQDESQIDDFYIGFGRDVSESTSPSFMTYQPTNRKTNYKRNHAGFTTADTFYIFLKAVNKAGLESVANIGPVVIDETPPVDTKAIDLNVNATHVTVSWDNETFMDVEQPEPMTSIFFQIESGGNSVTPLLEWNRYTSKPCETSMEGCIVYPVRLLQNKDTKEGRKFSLVLYVYNSAGHMLKTSTKPFKVPSKFPPGQGSILDIDPDNFNKYVDTDTHMTENTLCVAWNGFKHHENVTLEMGVGYKQYSDDIYPLQLVPNNGSACVRSSKIKQNIKYFITLRASCTGGTTLSSSDGVIIVNETNLVNSLKVETGLDCKSSAPLNEKLILGSNYSMDNFTLSRKLRTGHVYLIEILGNDKLDNIVIDSSDVMIEAMGESSIEFIPFTEQPEFTIHYTCNDSQDMTLNLKECRNSSFVDRNSKISGHWSMNISIESSLTYEVAIGENCKANVSGHVCAIQKTPFETVHSANSASVLVDSTQSKALYRLLVRPCIGSRCLTFAASPVIMTPKKIDIDIQEATLDHSGCLLISTIWTLEGVVDDIRFFQWTVSKDENASHALIDWITEIPKGDKHYSVQRCIELRTANQETMYTCVKAYTSWDSEVLRCTKLHSVPDSSILSNTLFEFDASLPSWDSTKRLLESQNLGERMAEFLDRELDFGNSSTSLAVTSTMASERNVTWFIMTDKFVPESCMSSDVCITSLETSFSSHAIFKHDAIPTNRILYSCAYSNSTTVMREDNVEILDEMNYCSDGFIIDTINPSAGEIKVPNTNRYITDVRHCVIHWQGFTDNVDGHNLGYPYPIKDYSISAGTRARGEDLYQKINVGYTHTYIFDNIQNEDGINVFITVTATDHAELETRVSTDLLILDSSPPTTGRIDIDGSISSIPTIAYDEIRLHLSEFEDPQSGLDYFDIGVGSQKYDPDVLPFEKYTSVFVTLNPRGNPRGMLDGMKYFVIVQAVNRAGLKSRPIWREFLVDMTPPSGGQVFDGPEDHEKDLDYQANLTYISGHWFGFDDKHTDISFYRVGLGSRPFIGDVEETVDVGLRTRVEWRKSFEPGRKYYITVECCNTAGLCSQVSSDGILLDNTDPIPGLVRVGHSETHGKYQAKNDSVHIQWSGFSDPESGIHHFGVCLGTRRNMCDIHPFFHCLLASSVTKTGLNIPMGTDIYASVRATNKVGRTIVTSSDAFQIDMTPPVLVEKPSIIVQYNSVAKTNVQYDPSVLRVKWEFQDNESPIVNHHLTLKTHHEGHTPIDNIELGSTNKMTIALEQQNWLRNGDRYHVVITSCNAAGLCSFAESNDVLIDSTPPHQGGFTSDLKWKNSQNGTSQVSLSWHSFVDAESGVKEFLVTASRNYSGSELSSGIVTIPNKINKKMQNGTIVLREELQADDKIYLSIWARNEAGLNSSVARVSVTALSASKSPTGLHGILEIEKHSCDTEYCSGDCTCAVVGRPCEKPVCTMNNSHSLVHDTIPLNIYWGLPNMVDSITASTACLAAHWNISDALNPSLPDILRFEYSIGLEGQDYGSDVFSKDRIPWIEFGDRKETVYCLTNGMNLTHGKSYVFYIRAWIDRDFFQTFNSAPILIDQTPPSIKKGGHIKDSDASCRTDFDIIDWMDTITACWDKVFVEPQGRIIYFKVALGTSPNVDDIIQTREVGLQTRLTVTNVTLQHGVKYYFTITAFNNVGLHTTLTSDGFIIDMDKPRSGMVFNTDKYRNAEFQSETSVFSISWNGFTDDHSAIKSYLVALVEESGDMDKEIGGASFKNTQLQTKYTFRNIKLMHGKRYKGLVKAIDGSNHESKIAASEYKMIDATASQGFRCESFTKLDEVEMALPIISLNGNFSVDNLYKIDGYLLTPNSGDVVLHFENGHHRLRLPYAVNHDGSLQFEYNFLSPYEGVRNVSIAIDSEGHVNGNITLWECESIVLDERNAVKVRQISPSMIAMNILVRDLESSVYKVLVGVGTTKGGFQLRPLRPISGGNNGILDVNAQHGTNVHVTVIAENHAGLRATFYSDPVVFDLSAPEMSNISHVLRIFDVEDKKANETDEIIAVVDMKWTAKDEESGARRCYCSFGYLPMSEDLLPWTPVMSFSSCSSGNLSLTHGTRFHGNVRCVNNVELLTEKTTEDLVVINEPPSVSNARVTFILINSDDGSSKWLGGFTNKQSIANVTLFAQSSLEELLVEWSGFDDTNGIDRYEYRLLDGDNVIIDYKDTKRMMTGFRFAKGRLAAGKTYTAKVVAINDGGYRSEKKLADIFVDDNVPKLTGQHVVIVQLGKDKVKVIWTDIFQQHPIFPCQFSVTIGTKEGQADVADINYTEDHETIVKIPTTGIDEERVQELFVMVECKYPTGKSTFTVYNHKMNS